MTRPVVRIDLADLPEDRVAEVADLLDELGLTGEELAAHLGLADELTQQLLAFSVDSLHDVFEGVLAAAGAAAAAKMGSLIKSLPPRTAKHPVWGVVAGWLLAGRKERSGFLLDQDSLTDETAITSMLHFDPASMPPGTILAWDRRQKKWRRLD